MKTEVRSFFDECTSTFTHVASDPTTGEAVVIDPVLDYDLRSGRTATTSADRVIAYVREAELAVDWILETHAHADHLSSAQYLRAELGGTTAIGEGIRSVQRTFATAFNLGSDFSTDGSQFDHLFSDGDRFRLGSLEARVLHTPGHTDDSVSYLIGDAVFVGDTLFAPDFGTARCDFPGGDPARLYDSIQRLLALPPDTRLYLCHDYPPDTRGPMAHTSIDEQRSNNIHLAGVSEADFVAMRRERDGQLSLPELIIPAVQVNIRAGALPPPEDNGVSYIKVPVDRM